MLALLCLKISKEIAFANWLTNLKTDKYFNTSFFSSPLKELFYVLLGEKIGIANLRC